MMETGTLMAAFFGTEKFSVILGPAKVEPFLAQQEFTVIDESQQELLRLVAP